MRTLVRFRSLLTALMVLFVTMYGPVLGVAAGVGTSAVASADSGTNFCVGLFTPGFWKNYTKNKAPMLTALPQTLDFSTYTPDFAVSVLQLQGKYVLRSLLSAELNVANSGLANDTFPSLSTTQTLGQLLHQAYLDYGTVPTTIAELASTPAIPAGFTQADQTLVAYVGNGGGEGASASTCKLGPPLPPPPVSDLSIVKTVDKSAVLAGDDLTYTIVAKNNGPDTASNVSVSDSVPANTTLVSLTPAAGWSCASGPAFPCSITSLANGASATFTLVVQVKNPTPGGTVITNTATVSPTDSTPTDNTSTVTSTVTPVSDLSIVKTVDKSAVLAGADLTYTIVAKNNGPDTATNLTVADTLPANTTFVSLTAAGGATCAAGPAFPCTIASLAANTTATFTLVVQVNAGTPGNTVITNTATVSPTDSTPSDNTSTVTSTVTPVSDLAITKTVDQTSVLAGTTLHYVVTATNGGDPANNVTVTDPLPANTTLVSFSSPAGWTCTSGYFPCSIPTFNGGASAQFAVAVQVNSTTTAGTVITNTSTVSPTDATPSDNTATVTTTVRAPVSDLAIVKTVDKATVLAGGNLTYTITATNGGPDAAANATVSDALPANTTFVSLTPPAGWTCTSGNFPCSIPSFANGTSATFTLVVQVKNPTPGGTVITNTATVSPTDSTPSDNTSTVTSTVTPVSDLAIVKTVDQSQVKAGDTLTYTITASNSGPDAAANATVSDALPANTTFVSLTPPAGWTCTSGNFPCSIASFASGASAVFTEQVQVSAGAAGGTVITNTATVSPTDSTPADNTSTVTSTVIASCSATTDTITGHYVDNNGAPIVNQTVWLLQNGVVDTAITGSGGGTGYAQTDSNGNFSFAGLQPGTYVVREAIRNGYVATEATLNGVAQSPANTSDVTVTIQSACDKENVGFTINSLPPCVSLISTSAFGTAPDGHQDVSVTLQDTSGSGLASIIVTGFNATILSYTINSGTPTTVPVNQAAPYTITLSSPTSASVTVLVETTNGTLYPGWGFDTNAFGANSCHGN